ncbi:hypothetical protein ACFQZC_09070 [Streptacidiphilus monticola]
MDGEILVPGRASASDFLIFGEDCEGEGVFEAIWLARPRARIEDQPVVCVGRYTWPQLTARDLADYLWALADTCTLMGIDASPVGSPNYELVSIAECFAPGSRRTADEAEALAAEEFPDFRAIFDPGVWERQIRTGRDR